MSELEMSNDVETEEEFTDELSDEALDREQRGGSMTFCDQHCICRAVS
jgi:hypothetical protein